MSALGSPGIVLGADAVWALSAKPSDELEAHGEDGIGSVALVPWVAKLFRGLEAAPVVVEGWLGPVALGSVLPAVVVALGLGGFVDLGVHTPAWQVLPVAHLTPQAPQLLGSVAVLTQATPQRVREAACHRREAKRSK